MIVVTGGAGFIGSNILISLERCGGYDLVVVDRLRSGNKWRNISSCALADIIAPEYLFTFLNRYRGDVELIIHMGAISSTTELDVDKIIVNNFSLSRAIWMWCATYNTRLIYASSAATYGDGSVGFDDDFSSEEVLSRLSPLNAYGWSKHLFDRWVWRAITYGIERPPQWVGLKFFNVYGPNEYHKGTQASIIAQVFPIIMRGNPCCLFRSYNKQYQDGRQMRDFVYVKDCVDIVLWFISQPTCSGLFNVGTGLARTFYDLVLTMYQVVQQEPQIQFISMPPVIRDKYQYFTEARINRLRTVGYVKPFTTLEEGVASYIRTYLMHTTTCQ